MKFGQLSKYEITITPTMNNALIVRVGCASFAFTSPKEMLLSLAEFYADPEKAEKEYHQFNSDCGYPIPDGPRNVEARGYGGTIREERRRPQTEEVMPDNEAKEQEEEAPRVGSQRLVPRHNFNLESDREAELEETVELELGDLEELLEEESFKEQE